MLAQPGGEAGVLALSADANVGGREPGANSCVLPTEQEVDPCRLTGDVLGDADGGPCEGAGAADSLEFHWRTLVPLELELNLSSAGVPLENLRSAGAPGDAPGHGQAVPNSWMRQCLESELDGEFWLVKDPSQCKSTWSVKVVVTFEQKLQPKIFAPTSSFRFNFELVSSV